MERSLDSYLAESRHDSSWSEPFMFDLHKPQDRKDLEQRFRSGAVSTIYDSIDTIANNLFDLEHPDKLSDEVSRRRFVNDKRFKGHDYGSWVLFQWSQELVRYPEPKDYQDLVTYRYHNLLTKEDILNLSFARVAIIGMSVGGVVATSLARNRVGGEMFLSDMARPSVSNLGRADYDMRDLSSSKVDACAKRISYINPFLRQVHMREGVNLGNVNELLDFNPSLVFDETDSMETSAVLREFCANNRIVYLGVSDVHDHAVLEVCRHDYGEAPLYAGDVEASVAHDLIYGNVSKESQLDIFARTVGYENITSELMASSEEIGKTIAGIPQLGSTSMAAAGFVTAVARDIILGKDVKTGLYTLPLNIE